MSVPGRRQGRTNKEVFPSYLLPLRVLAGPVELPREPRRHLDQPLLSLKERHLLLFNLVLLRLFWRWAYDLGGLINSAPAPGFHNAVSSVST